MRFDAQAARAEVDAGGHTLAVGFQPGQPKRFTVDGAPVERLIDAPGRPLVAVFLPDRLELIKGAPALRRAHLDQVVAALWPSRAATRRAYAQALAQRNALIARVRAGRASRDALPAVGRRARRLRHRAAQRPRPLQPSCCASPSRAGATSSGWPASPSCATGRGPARRPPRSWPPSWRERLESDLERGFTGHGPHRDDLVALRDGRELRAYGSQGEQRLALLALLLAERERARPPSAEPRRCCCSTTS